MRRQIKQKGFTLIEIIVVLIILGILASMALSNLFAHVLRSRGTEAIVTMQNQKAQIIGCLTANNGTESACNTLSFQSSANFDYGLQGAPFSDGGTHAWTLMASPNTLNYGFRPWADRVYLVSDAVGNISCSGGGSLQGIC
jgi:type IV pilus assembly protein PilE